MNLRNLKININLIILFFLSFYSFTVAAQNGKIAGSIIDGQSKEVLLGVTIQLENTTNGAVTDFDGNYMIENVTPGKYNLRISYISYETKTIQNVLVKSKETTKIDAALMPADLKIDEVVVIARKNLENEKALLIERQKASISIENMGSKEMSIKGISNVADGIKKITGISIEGNKQVFVRGLGDRYSLTTLNGIVIASPNPDNKLIPLHLFSSAIVKNITVSKVYQSSVAGDYAGAHIDIETKENTGSDYLTVNLSGGGKLNALFSDFYQSDKQGGIPYLGFMKGKRLSQTVKDMKSADFRDYARNNAPFKISFAISKNKALPEIGLGIGAGKSWEIGNQKLNLALALNFKNDYTIYENAYTSTITKEGDLTDKFDYDKYSYSTTVSGIFQMGYTLRKNDYISYNLLYVNDTEDSYSSRDGFDAEGVELKGSNSIYHRYALINNQLAGKHLLGKNWQLDWKGSYGITSSEEPDRRQIMFRKGDNGKLTLFTLNQQETMRFFGELDEDEWAGDLKLKYNFRTTISESNIIRFGGAYRDKTRDFYSANFYYNVKGIHPDITNIYDTDEYLNNENLANGSIYIDKSSLPRNKYFGENNVTAAFVETELFLTKQLLLAAGVRYENSSMQVRYWDDYSVEQKARLNTDDLFPALNLKYMISSYNNLRLSASRTVTRPSFIEMAPFEYKELYGGATVRGYADIKNGYNYNLDIRYELFPASGDLYSIGAYYKYLDSPIERVQEYSGSAIHTFRNVEKGQVAGVEIEMRKQLFKNIKAGINASYIYTKVNLPGEGVYTDKARALQGASPYLVNADINYAPEFGKEGKLSLSFIYNLQGPRINTVGINGVGNVEEQAYHTLDFVGNIALSRKLQLKLQAKNLLNQRHEFKQDIGNSGESKTVEYYKSGIGIELGISLRFY